MNLNIKNLNLRLDRLEKQLLKGYHQKVALVLMALNLEDADSTESLKKKCSDLKQLEINFRDWFDKNFPQYSEYIAKNGTPNLRLLFSYAKWDRNDFKFERGRLLQKMKDMKMIDRRLSKEYESGRRRYEIFLTQEGKEKYKTLIEIVMSNETARLGLGQF